MIMKRNKFILISILFLIIFPSCLKIERTSDVIILINNTDFSLEVSYNKGGGIDIINIPPQIFRSGYLTLNNLNYDANLLNAENFSLITNQIKIYRLVDLDTVFVSKSHYIDIKNWDVSSVKDMEYKENRYIFVIEEKIFNE